MTTIDPGIATPTQRPMEQRQFRRGDVYIIYEGVGSEQSIGNEIRCKDGRPAVIVQNDCARDSGTATVVYLSSAPDLSEDTASGRKKMTMSTHVPTYVSGRHGYALCEKIYTISSQRIGPRIDVLPTHVMNRINVALAIALQLDQLTSVNELTETVRLQREVIRFLMSQIQNGADVSDASIDGLLNTVV